MWTAYNSGVYCRNGRWRCNWLCQWFKGFGKWSSGGLGSDSGGVKASLSNTDYGLLNKWLRNLKDVYRLHKDEVEAETNIDDKVNKLVEMNLIEQVGNVVKTSIVQKAWKKHKRPHVHGWVYEMETGLLKTVIDVEPGAAIDPMYEFREL